MKLIKYFVFGILFSIAATSHINAQQSNQPIEQNFYYRALEKVLSNSTASVVEYDIHINSKFPKVINSSHIDYLYDSQLIEKYRKEKKKFQMIKMFPMVNKGNVIKVSFNYYWISYKKKRLEFALEGGTTVTFRFDCEKKEFVIDKTDSWGV